MTLVDRFQTPLYTIAEASRHLGVPQPTLRRWAHGDAGARPAVVTAVPRQRARDPVIPFIGLAEALVLAAMRRSGVPLQRIRPALNRLSAEFGLDHALASRWLSTDGAEVVYDYARTTDDPASARAARELVVVRNDRACSTMWSTDISAGSSSIGTDMRGGSGFRGTRSPR